jgi:hypothetical protein
VYGSWKPLYLPIESSPFENDSVALLAKKNGLPKQAVLVLRFVEGLESKPERELQVALGSRYAAGDDAEVPISSESL